MNHWFVRMSTVQDIIFKPNPMTHYTYGHSKGCFGLNKRFNQDNYVKVTKPIQLIRTFLFANRAPLCFNSSLDS